MKLTPTQRRELYAEGRSDAHDGRECASWLIAILAGPLAGRLYAMGYRRGVRERTC